MGDRTANKGKIMLKFSVKSLFIIMTDAAYTF